MDWWKTGDSWGLINVSMRKGATARGGSGGGKGSVLHQIANADPLGNGGAISGGLTLDTSIQPTGSWFAYSAANLTVTATGAAAVHSGHTKTTGAGKSTGKWYTEWVCNALNSANASANGACFVSGYTQDKYINENVSLTGWCLPYVQNGWTGRIENAGTTFVAYRTAHAATNVIGAAIDLTNRKLWWRLNGTWQGGGDPATDTSPSVTWVTAGKTWYPGIGLDEGASGSRPSYTWRSDSSSFTGSIPTGYTAYA